MAVAVRIRPVVFVMAEYVEDEVIIPHVTAPVPRANEVPAILVAPVIAPARPNEVADMLVAPVIVPASVKEDPEIVFEPTMFP